MMLKSILRGNAACLILFLSTSTVCAQQAGGNTAAGGTGPVPEATLNESLDPDAVFTAIERGSAVGSGTESVPGSSAVGGGGGAGARGGAGGLGGLGGGFGAFGGGLGGFGNLFGNLNNQNASSGPAIRTRLRSAVNVPATPPARVQQVATRRFQSLANRPQLRGIQVTMQGRTAMIRGNVGTERDRRMSELLIRLEPGVSRVDNQVVVTSEDQSPTSSSDLRP
jgi:hypothetical protein